MLHQYVGECMVSTINTNNGKEPPCGYQNCDPNGILIFGEYAKVRESFRTLVIIWVKTILNHIETRAILPR